MARTLAVLAAAIAMVALAGCASTNGAARLQGQIAAGVTLPEWPAECRRKEVHAALKKGEDIRVILKRERDALDRQNARTDVCARFFDRLRAEFGDAGR